MMQKHFLNNVIQSNGSIQGRRTGLNSGGALRRGGEFRGI